MNSLMRIIVIWTLHKLSGTSNILENKDVRLDLEYLCPGVDICNPNHPDGRINPNVIYNGNKASCCFGCSCHMNCHLSVNCCFPKDKGNVTNSHLPTFDNGNSSMDEDSSHNSKDSISSKTMHAHSKKTIKNGFDQRSPVDSNVTHIDIDQPVQQHCLYIRTGTPEENWVKNALAYRIVATPPTSGCIPSPSCNALAKHSQHAACDSKDVAPWGDLFPVYSPENGLIYKNALCACCHGVSDYEFLTPMLVCDELDEHTLLGISYVEHFRFLQHSNTFSNHCFVHFHHSATRTMLDHRCFVDTIDQCPLALASSLFPVPDNFNLSRSDIVMACYNGPYVPIKCGRVYKNAFCALCNSVAGFANKRCYFNVYDSGRLDKSLGLLKITYLIDTTSLMMLTPGGKNTGTAPYPVACLKTSTGWIDKSCRSTECPTGQGRNGDGICIVLYKTLFRHTYAFVKLTYIKGNTSILPILNKDEVSENFIRNAFQMSKPWQGWDITGLHHTSEDNQDGPLVAVGLIKEITLTETLVTEITLSLRSLWNISLDGKHIAFEQSLMEYTLVTMEENRKAPSWSKYVDKTVPSANVPNTQTMYWESLITQFMMLHTPFQVTKLLSCEQVSLFEDEFNIMSGGFILVNKITNKTMFDREFELVEDENGNLVPIVCLADTPLVLRNVNSSSQSLSNSLLHLALIICLVQCAIDLCYVPLWYIDATMMLMKVYHD